MAPKLPTEKFYGLSSDKEIEYRGDSLYVEINNFVKCPMRYSVYSENKETQKLLETHMPITMDAVTDTSFYIPIPKELQNEFQLSINYGDPTRPITNPKMTFPFKAGKKYKIIQGNNSEPSHNYAGSRYALDFSLKINDTICSATDGYVVAMVEGYEHGGPLKKWRPYANYIFVYNEEANLFYNYGHLVQNGSFVEVGDTVKLGQPIGLSGLTGYTTVEHLHFDVKKAVYNKEGLESTLHSYINGVRSTELKRGQVVSISNGQ